MSGIDDDVSTGETVVAILKRDGKPKRTVDDKGRYEITLTIKDRTTGEVERFEVKPS